jgi:4-amino-4-deoxy-L-arabinose transferase-like glycosyltransferase
MAARQPAAPQAANGAAVSAQRMNGTSRIGLAVLTAGVLLVYGVKLDHTPPDLHRDEVVFALQAQSIASTARDVEGRRLPLYFHMPALGDDVWFCPILVYVTAAFLKVLPLSEIAVRLPSVGIGALNVVLTFFLARLLFDDDRWALFAAAMLAMTPAHVIHSRLAFDFIYPVPFVLTWLICLAHYLQRPRPWLLFLSTSCLGLGVYSYIASVIMMPVYLALTGAILYASSVRSPRAYAIALAGFAWPLALLVPWLALHPVVFTDTMARYQIGGFRHIGSPGGGPRLLATLRGIAAGAQPANIAQRLSTYWTFYDPSYLFVYGGYTRLTNSTRHAGLFLLPLIVFVPLGIGHVLTRRRSPMTVLILLGFVLAPLAACLAAKDPYASDRELAVLPFGVLLAAYGVERLLAVRVWWGRRAAIALLAMVPLHFLFFEADYFTDYHRRAAFWFEWNHRGGVEEILARVAHDERPILLSSSRDTVMESYWRFAALKQGRADLLQRPIYFDWPHFDVASVPPRSLILATRNDAPLIAAAESGALRRLVDIPEPGDPPYFVVLER